MDDNELHDDDGNDGITINRTTLMVGLGTFCVLGSLLLVLRAARQVRPANSDTFVIGDDWKVSMQHMADAITFRLNGIEERLNDIDNRAPIGVSRVVDVPPAPEPVSANGDGADESPTVDVLGEHGTLNEPGPPPRNAAVSVPDVAGQDQ